MPNTVYTFSPDEKCCLSLQTLPFFIAIDLQSYNNMNSGQIDIVNTKMRGEKKGLDTDSTS